MLQNQINQANYDLLNIVEELRLDPLAAKISDNLWADDVMYRIHALAPPPNLD